MPIEEGRWVCPDKALSIKPGTFLKPVPGMRNLGFREQEVDKLTDSPIWQLTLTKGIGMDLEQAAVEVSGSAETALKSLKASVDKFKSTITNDLTSMKAASSRIQSETNQMKQAYSETQALLTTAEFERAVQNAERMAVALKAISELSGTKLNVTMFTEGSKA